MHMTTIILQYLVEGYFLVIKTINTHVRMRILYTIDNLCSIWVVHYTCYIQMYTTTLYMVNCRDNVHVRYIHVRLKMTHAPKRHTQQDCIPN